MKDPPVIQKRWARQAECLDNDTRGSLPCQGALNTWCCWTVWYPMSSTRTASLRFIHRCKRPLYCGCYHWLKKGLTAAGKCAPPVQFCRWRVRMSYQTPQKVKEEMCRTISILTEYKLSIKNSKERLFQKAVVAMATLPELKLVEQEL